MSGTLRAGLGILGSIESFDPQKVISLTDAHLSRNLYSRLVNMDDNGQVRGEIAKDFIWDGKSFVINLREGLKTVDGYAINEESVKYSILRILRKIKVSHGNLRQWLCPDFDTESMHCDGLKTFPGQVVLTPARPDQHQFLMALFASTDFSIVPKQVIDLSHPDWPITEYRNTTGVYYVSEKSEDGNQTWSLNENHPWSTPDLFRTIEIVPVAPGPESKKAFASGRVDFLPSSSGLKPSDILDLGSGVSVHESFPIKVVQVGFTSEGKKKFGKEQRLGLATLIKGSLMGLLDSGTGTLTDQIFPPDGDGWLEPSDLRDYKNALASAHFHSTQKIRIGIGPSYFELFQSALKDEKRFELIPISNVSEVQRPEKRIDAFILGGDTSFYESISMIHYYFSMENFGDYEQGLSWINNFMSIQSKVDRLQKLRELHLSLLMNASVVPLYAAPYVAVARSPIRMEISKFFAGTPMWKVSRK